MRQDDATPKRTRPGPSGALYRGTLMALDVHSFRTQYVVVHWLRVPGDVGRPGEQSFFGFFPRRNPVLTRIVIAYHILLELWKDFQFM